MSLRAEQAKWEAIAQQSSFHRLRVARPGLADRKNPFCSERQIEDDFELKIRNKVSEADRSAS